MSIEQLQREFELDCQYHPFPLHPETPEAGISLERLFGGRMDVPAIMAQLHQVADSLDLPFGNRTDTYNSRNAQELGVWVTEEGKFEEYLAAVYRAYFVDATNISTPPVLLAIIERLGLDVTQAKKILENHSYAPEIDATWDNALSSNIRAVPTLRCEGRDLTGFQSMEACRQLIIG